MARKLADELLHEILEARLRVPDIMFHSVDIVSPFSFVTCSSSDFLLVCRRWMRIATHILYECVVVRSAGQAAALARVLERNPALAAYIRRLRVEGSWPKWIWPKIILKMSGVRELCVPIDVQGTSQPLDVIELIKLMDPEHLILCTFKDHAQWSYAHQLVKAAIARTLPTWSNLTHLKMTEPVWNRLTPSLVPMLTHCPTLATISLDYACGVIPCVIPTQLEVLHNPAIQLLEFIRNENAGVYSCEGWQGGVIAAGWVEGASSAEVDSALRSRRVRVFEGGRTASHFDASPAGSGSEFALRSSPLLPPRASWHPMQQVKKGTRLAIWSYIFSCLLDQNPQEFLKEAYLDHVSQRWWHPVDQNRVKLLFKLMTVSRDVKTAAHRALFSTLYISSTKTLANVCELIRADWRLGSSIIKLSVDLSNILKSHTDSIIYLAEAVKRVSICVVRSRSTIQHSTPLAWLANFASSTGHFLRQLIVDLKVSKTALNKTGKMPVLDSVAIFGELRMLEELVWNVENWPVAKWPTASVGGVQEIPNPMPQLNKLRVGRTHPTFIRMLKVLALPKLASVDVSRCNHPVQHFLSAHGSKICTYIYNGDLTPENLEALTNLEELTFSEYPNKLNDLQLVSIQVLNLAWSSTGRGVSLYQEAFNIIGARRTIAFTALEQIRIASKGLWPTDEYHEMKSPWPTLATKMFDLGITIFDADGRTWRRRVVAPTTAEYARKTDKSARKVDLDQTHLERYFNKAPVGMNGSGSDIVQLGEEDASDDEIQALGDDEPQQRSVDSDEITVVD